ncbi:MAG: hypothetical protein ABFD98_10180 [Syntrophobacteraceae bacterium]
MTEKKCKARGSNLQEIFSTENDALEEFPLVVVREVLEAAN